MNKKTVKEIQLRFCRRQLFGQKPTQPERRLQEWPRHQYWLFIKRKIWWLRYSKIEFFIIHWQLKIGRHRGYNTQKGGKTFYRARLQPLEKSLLFLVIPPNPTRQNKIVIRWRPRRLERARLSVAKTSFDEKELCSSEEWKEEFDQSHTQDFQKRVLQVFHHWYERVLDGHVVPIFDLKGHSVPWKRWVSRSAIGVHTCWNVGCYSVHMLHVRRASILQQLSSWVNLRASSRFYGFREATQNDSIYQD